MNINQVLAVGKKISSEVSQNVTLPIENVQKGASEDLLKTLDCLGVNNIVKKTSKYVDSNGEYLNKQVVRQIQELKPESPTLIEDIKNVFLKELGYDTDLIAISSKNFKNSGGEFSLIDGCIDFNSDFLSSLSKEQIAALIRHELDHFDKAAKICKAIGVDEYKKLVLSPYSGFQTQQLARQGIEFSENFWLNASNQANTKDFDFNKYYKALKEFLLNEENDESISLYNHFTNYQKYYSNEFEASAYEIQHSLEKVLKTENTMQGSEMSVSKFGEFNKVFEKKLPNEQEREVVFDYLYDTVQEDLEPTLPNIASGVLHKIIGKQEYFELQSRVFDKMRTIVDQNISKDTVVESYLYKLDYIDDYVRHNKLAVFTDYFDEMLEYATKNEIRDSRIDEIYDALRGMSE